MVSKEDKAWEKFCREPIPNDITFDEMVIIANRMGCKLKTGGKHPKIVHVPSGTVIAVPHHGRNVGEAYIKQLKDLFCKIKEERL